MQLAAPRGVRDRSLTVDADFQAWNVRLDDTAGIEAGHLLCLSTDTLVLTVRGWPYRKQAHILVAGVDHEAGIVHLTEPLNFHFMREETHVETRIPSRLCMNGVSFEAVGRSQLRFIALDWLIDDATLRGRKRHTVGDVLLLARCVRGRGNNLTLLDSRYTINVSAGSRHQRFSQITARGTRHPIDANTFAFDTLVEDIVSYDSLGTIQCHPSFLTRFVRCRDISAASGGAGLRGLGCSTEDCTATNIEHSPKKDVQSPLLRPEYAYLGEFYDTRHVRFTSDTAILSAAFCRRFVVQACDVPAIVIDGRQTHDGNSLRVVQAVQIDAETRADLQIRRVPVLTSDNVLEVTPLSEAGTLTVVARKVPGLGFAPRLRYRVALRRGEAEGIGGAPLSISLVLKHNWSIWEPARRHLSICRRALPTALGYAERRYEIIVDQDAETVRMNAVDGSPAFASLLRLSIASAVPHFRNSAETAAKSPGDPDQSWLAFTIVAAVLAPSDPVERIDAEIEETRLT